MFGYLFIKAIFGWEEIKTIFGLNKGGRMVRGQQLVAHAWLDKDFKTRQ